MNMWGVRLFSACVQLLVLLAVFEAASAEDNAPARTALFGELHIHSSWSYDSYFLNVRSTPEDAYRYNTGHAIEHFDGSWVRARAPLDFMALTDHAEYLMFGQLLNDQQHPLSQTEFGKRFASSDSEISRAAFESMTGKDRTKFPQFPGRMEEEAAQSVWSKYIALAEKYNDPGTFTTFVGYEWTALPNNQNLHRNVIFAGNDVPAVPFSSVASTNPEDLWKWMDTVRRDGSDVLAIPHNSNLSNGLMFALQMWDGTPLDADYAALRMRNEPLVEITQIKGTSDTHPALSPNDEWANFEILDTLIAAHETVGKTEGSYVRDAYLSGLAFESESGFNPYKFGLIGSSDGHNSTSPIDEDNYTGKMGAMDGTAELRRGANAIHPSNASYSASGLTGVWAEENTRASIFAALKRKETFATTGTRIKLRFFASFDFEADLLSRKDWRDTAYGSGVPMGSTLSGYVGDASPKFAVWAIKDPASAWLQRAQVVKGWVEDGETKELVFDVACSDGQVPDADSHRCPDNGADVNVETCDFSKSAGDTEMTVIWQDPDFDSNQHAFYYARILENPTCRWSTWEANRHGWPLLDNVPATLQERAWSSPIWYAP